jgi:serine/threonine protein kinase/formylglycine-generating enzyme required for sulfatase activity
MADSALNVAFDIPGYRVVRELGEGGMATVYLAIQLSLGRPVAIKVLAAERTPSEELVTRFEHEARTIARLDHPHIVSIFDVGRTSTSQLYYSMPYLPNGDLASRDLRDDPAMVFAVMRALGEALDYAHDQGIVHRDVKPENVLFDKLNRPLLADFGIALTTRGKIRVTAEGTALGSVGYMSPEQSRGQASDGRSDIYSLGVVCYEMLTGELPYPGDDGLSVALAHVEKPVPRLPSAQRHWQPLIDKTMAKQPSQRFQNAKEFLAALDGLEQRTLAQKAVPARYRWAQFVRALPGSRRRAPWLIGFASVLVLAVASGVALAIRSQTQPVSAASTSTSTPAVDPPRLVANVTEDTKDINIPVSKVADVPVALITPPPADDKPAPSSESPLATPPVITAPSTPAPIPTPAPPLARKAPHDRNGPDLVLIPAQAERKGKRLAKLNPVFALAAHEVTRGEFATFVRMSGVQPSGCREPMQLFSRLRMLSWRDPGFAQDDRHPVVCVSYDDAVAYAHWLSERTGARYRLPSSDEWLRAARQLAEGGPCEVGNGADATPESGSADASGNDRYKCRDGFAHTAPVGRFRANPLGLYDLGGNVSEWVADCSRETEGGACKERVFRGTSWRDGSDQSALVRRGESAPDIGYTTIGFRLLREVPATLKSVSSK